MQLAERMRTAIEQRKVPGAGLDPAIRCTATIGVSTAFSSTQGFDESMQQVDAALYRGKAAGHNRVEWAQTQEANTY